jgi:hypothetical protein
MPRRRGSSRSSVDRGRGFYETASPFETYDPDAGGSKPKTWEGYSDEFPAETAPRQTGATGGEATDLAGETSREIMRKMQAEQYDNPRGFPGLTMVTSGDQKSKLPFKQQTSHSITHQIEGQGRLARTGK